MDLFSFDLFNLDTLILLLEIVCSRVIGGDETLAHQYPWAALVRYHIGEEEEGNHGDCGGTVITRRSINI